MIGKNNLLKKQQKQGTRVETYSIKKFKVGAASVLVGVGIFFGAGAAQASDQTAENTAGKNTNVDAGASNANVVANANVATEAKVEANTNAATEVKVETKEEAKAEVNANATAETKVEADKNTAAETKVDAENKEVEAKAETKEEAAKEDKKEEAKPAAKVDKKEVKVDNTKLSNYISNIKSNIQSGKYANKTDESLDELKKALANAEITAGTATSQSQLDKAYQTLVTTANSRLRNRSKDAVESKVKVKPEDKTEPKPETNAIANTGKNDPRNGKEINKNAAFRADVAGAGSGIGADVEDATATPKAEKPTEFSKINAKELVKQINWLDFGDTSAWTNTTTTKDGRTALQVGSTFTKEIMPGYIVNIKVKSLKPFQATEIYKNRMEAEGATEAEKATYDPNAKNGYIGTIGDPKTKAAFNNSEEALVAADTQNRWTEIRNEGIDTGSKRTTISSEYNGANIGVQFEISATFRGKSVKPAVVAADGESANPGELVMFTTNGTGWKHIGEWKKAANSELYAVQDTHNYFDPANNYSRSKPINVNGTNINGLNLELLRNANEVGPDKKPVAWKYFGSPDQVTGGLGTGVFGPNVSASRFSVPLVMTQGASEVGLYIASSGKQSGMIGFFPLDEGDAPESYGKAQHSIGTVDGVTGTKLAQPYLGSVSPDMDENNAKDWTGDDNTISADEGVDQILPDNLKGQTNDMIKLDRTRPGTYTLDVEAHTGGAAKAYVYGWIDFNQNGKFDEDERSDLATITQDGPVRLHFNNAKTMIDPSITELGTRVRIASNQSDIENPTGLALSGEVEDFKTQITFPPKGERKETIDVQGATQTATVAFTAQGLSKYSRDKNAEIDQTVAPVIIDNRTKQVINPKADGYYVIPGEGKYKVTPNGNNVDIEFTPEDNFVGTASGISIRRTDNNGYTTDWISKDKTLLPSINEVMDNMDGLYIPTVTPKNIEGIDKTSTDVQGATQTGTPEFELEGTNSNGEKVKVTPDLDYPAKLVDPATGQVTDEATVTVAGEGTYTIDQATGKVTFKPEPGFTGTANGVTVSVTAPVGRDKDGQVPADALKTATAKYTPTVTPITLTPTDKVSEDVQNVPQTQTPTFELSNDKTAKITSKKLVDPATGQPTDATTVTVAGEGSYTIDPTTGAVTFVPEENFIGTAKGITVQATATIKNEDGKTTTITADATYTPTVVPAVPTAQPAKSIDVQGATQKGKPTFEGTTVTVNGQQKPVTIKENSYKLLDKDGNEVTSTPAYAEDGTTVIGTHTIDPTTGEVTFTPTDKSYSGKVTPVSVQAESSNGIKVSTTYTPEIVPVTPTAQDAATKDIQGKTQKGKPTFEGGKATVDGVEKTVEIDEDTPATFEDGSTTKTIPGEGTYTVAPDGTVTFVPEKTFTGEGTGVTVKRVDKNGTEVTAKYTPTVTPVTPTADPAETTGKQGQVQTGAPTFTAGNPDVPMNDAVPATFEDGKTTKTVDGVGTYTVAPDGTVTFTPVPSFVGKAPAVTVVREDMNGTKASATYTPTVTPVTPTATPAESVAPQGIVQSGTVTFTEGDPVAPINKETITLLDENGQPAASVEAKSPEGKVIGTYTVDKATGVVTFTPTDKSYSGDVVPVKVQAKDANGTTVETTYTPKITPVTPTAQDAATKDIQGKTQTGTPTFTEGNPLVPIDEDTPATFEDGSKTKTIPGEGTYTVAPDGTVTFVPEKSFTGKGTGVTVKRVDKNGTEVTAKYTPTVTPVTPTADPAETTGKQGQVQTGAPTFTAGNPDVPMNDAVPATFEDGKTTKTVDGVGTYTVAPDGTVTFTPVPSFVGKAPAVTVVREDMNGTKASATYTPTVTPVTPTAEDVTSKDIQGKTQTGTPTFTEGDPVVPMDDSVPATFEDGSTTKKVDGEGTYTVAPDGTVTFVPEKSFTGTATGVTVKRVDKNGTEVTAKYTPTVTPVTPTADPAETTGKQGQVQTGAPTFTAGNPDVPMNDAVPATFEDGKTTKTVDGVGTYTVAPDGTVTFTPEPSFVGKAPSVTVVREDMNGTKASATYTPTVTPVTPVATPAESVAPQGIVQTGTVTFTAGNPVAPINKQTITLLDENGKPAESVDAKSPEGKVVGKYTVDKATGVVTFTPTDKSYSGDVVPVKVQAKDANGTTVETTYTPKITPVAPTADPAESIGKQGQEQTGKPTFTPGNPAVPMNDDTPATFEDGKTTKTVDGVGTYTVAPDGTVTFKPVPSFVGEAPSVTVVREDMNGTKVSAKYTPTVTPVRPTGEEVTSEDIQGKTQTGKPTFTEGDPVVPMDDSVPATFEDGSTTKTIPGEGTYTVAPDGTVTFVPEKSFTGKGTGVTVKRVDKNGTEVTAKYTPTVTPVTPTADPAETTGKQGQVQTGAPTFTAGNPDVPMNDAVPATFEDGKTTKTVDGVGTYTVAPDGTVTFKPVPSFVGKAPAVTVVRVDKNGTKASATYTPTVTPVTPTSEDVTSVDVQGKTQTGTPVFTPGNPAVPMDDKVPATFEDGSTTKKVDGEGTYTVAPDGTVTFVPEKSFTGTATGVTVKRLDKNGTAITAKYTPTVTPVTPTAEPAESIGPKGQEQSGKPTFTPGNPEVPMNDEVPATFEDGSTTKKVDGVGTYTVAKDGTVTFKPEPEFVGKAPSVTVVREDKNGTKVSATYTPTVTPSTKYVDNNGKAIPGYPEVDGTVEKKDIPGYTYVGTKTDEKGNTTHIYEKVVTPVPTPTPNEPVKPVVPSVEKVEKVKPQAKPKAKRLANTGEAETHSTLAGFGLLVLGGLVAAARRRKEK